MVTVHHPDDLKHDWPVALKVLHPELLPYFLSPAWLRIDPTFDPLLKHPRFQPLVAGN